MLLRVQPGFGVSVKFEKLRHWIENHTRGSRLEALSGTTRGGSYIPFTLLRGDNKGCDVVLSVPKPINTAEIKSRRDLFSIATQFGMKVEDFIQMVNTGGFLPPGTGKKTGFEDPRSKTTSKQTAKFVKNHLSVKA